MFFSLPVLHRDEKTILELEFELSLSKPGILVSSQFSMRNHWLSLHTKFRGLPSKQDLLLSLQILRKYKPFISDDILSTDKTFIITTT